MDRSTSHRGSPHTPAPKIQRLGQAFEWKSTALPWRKAIGAAATTALLMGLGLVTGHWTYGVWAFMGAFTSIYVAPQPYRQRAGTLFAVLIGLAIAMGIASLTSVSWWMTALALGFISATATFLTGAWRIPLPQSLMFILIACIAAALPADPRQAPVRVAFVFIGGMAAWLQGMIGWVFHPRKPETAAVEKAYRQVAQYFGVLSTSSSLHAQHQAALALQEAEDSVAELRGQGVAQGSDDRLIWLAEQAEDLFRAVVALSAEHEGPTPEPWKEAVAGFADAVRTKGDPPQLPDAQNDSAAWKHFRQRVERIANAFTEPVPSLRRARGSPPASAKRRLSLAVHEDAIKLASYRMGIAVTLAAFLGHALGEAHPYWLPLTVGAILQGPTAMTMAWRSIQRVAGTIVGLGLTLVLLLGHPTQPVFLGAIVLLQFFMLLLIVRNYAVSVVLITTMALAIISSEIHPPAWPLVSARFLDTLVGAAVAIAAIRLLWSRRSALGLSPALATSIRQTGRLLDLTFYREAHASPEARTQAERELTASVLHLRSAYDRALNEISVPSEVISLWPAVVAVQRLAYLIPALGDRKSYPALDPRSRQETAELFKTLAQSAQGGPEKLAWANVAIPNFPHLQLLRWQLNALIDALQHASPPKPSSVEAVR